MIEIRFVVCVMMPCKLVWGYPEDGGNNFLRNDGDYRAGRVHRITTQINTLLKFKCGILTGNDKAGQTCLFLPFTSGILLCVHRLKNEKGQYDCLQNRRLNLSCQEGRQVTYPIYKTSVRYI
jgi:hypothetical protein